MKQDHYRALKRKILATMILAPVIPFIIALLIGYYHFTASLQGSAISKMVRIVEDHRRLIEMFLNERRADLRFIADTYQFQSLSQPERLEKVLANLKNKSPAFVDLGVFNEAGVHVAYQGPYQLTGKVYKDAQWFKEVMKRGYYISNVFLGYRRIPHFVVAVAVKDEGRTWVTRATIDTLLFTDIVEKVRIGKTGEAYILNGEGILQTQRRSGGNLLEKAWDGIEHLKPHEGIRTFVQKNVAGVSYLLATAWLNDGNWALVVRQEKADAFKALRSATYLVVLISILGGVFIVALAFYMTNSIIRRMERADEEKDQLNQQLIIAGRLAEIGEMSAGFAHEINNPLQIIRAEQTLAETVLNEMRDQAELKETENLAELEDSIRQIKLQVDRCGTITQALLKFARQKEPLVSEVDLGGLIPEVLEMVSKKASVSGIAINQELPEGPILVRADWGQLQQVLLNLLNNAIDAIEEKHGAEGGQIRVMVRSTGSRVEMSVSDNGSGISPENIEKMFTPFFTTKPVGKGTGLGLSVCFGIIDKMGGSIQVNSEPGRGTTFNILLPAAG